MELSLGFSPCPNDCFMFDAIVNQRIDLEGLTFLTHLDDVEAALTPEQIRSELQRMKSGEPTRFFSRWRCADGRIIDIDVNCRYRPEDEAIYGYVRDITDSLSPPRVASSN